MLERSVACSDLSSLHSYFSTGIVLLMSPLHNRCHLSVRLRALQNLRGFSGYDCKTEQGADVGNSFFRQAFDTLSKARQGRVGEQTGFTERCRNRRKYDRRNHRSRLSATMLAV